MHVITTAVRLTQKQHAALIYAIDNSVCGHSIYCVSQTSKGGKQVTDMNDVLSRTSCFDNTFPFHPGVNPYAAFQMIGFTATIDPVGLPGGTCILHKGTVVTHHDNNRVFGNAKLVHFSDDLAYPLIDLNKNVGDSPAVEGVVLTFKFLNK